LHHHVRNISTYIQMLAFFLSVCLGNKKCHRDRFKLASANQLSPFNFYLASCLFSSNFGIYAAFSSERTAFEPTNKRPAHTRREPGRCNWRIPDTTAAETTLLSVCTKFRNVNPH
ncbi:unnamed protein product, partial [Ectocarpus sp. 12 AP-2014]